MIVTLVLLLLQAAPAADDEKIRARIRVLVEKLSDDDYETRVNAEKELLGFPTRFSRDIAALGLKSPDFEVRSRAGRVVLPEPWDRMLPGTLGQAKAVLEAILDPNASGRHATIERVLVDLERAPPKDAPALFLALLERPEDGARECALAGLARFPLDDPAPLIAWVRDPKTALRAVAALTAARDASRVERAILQILPDDPPGHDQLVELLVRQGSERSLPVLRAYFERHPNPARRDHALLALRDPEWARAHLAMVRKDTSKMYRLPLSQIAAVAGPALRDDVHAWLDESAPRIALQKEILPLLGAVGCKEDGAYLVDRLKEALVAEAAAEALDRLGDPSHARKLAEAWKTSRLSNRFDRIVMSLRPEAVEDVLVEVFSDPGIYLAHFDAAFALAELRLAPRLREALYRGILEGGNDWAPARAEALRLLARGVPREDIPRIEKLRTHADTTIRACGLILALSSGDAAAGRELAEFLSRAPRFLLPHRTSLPSGGHGHLLAWGTPADPSWTNAVIEEWHRRPDWNDAAIFLTEREVREAQEHLRARLDRLDGVTRREAERALAAQGDATSLDRIFERARSGFLDPKEERAFLAAASRKRRDRVLDVTRDEVSAAPPCLVRLAGLLALPEGIPFYRQVVFRDLPDGRWEEQDDGTTAECARALARLQAKDAVPELRRLLRSRYASSRAAAAEALAALNDRGAIPLVLRLVDDPSEIRAEDERGPIRRVWHAAMESFQKLSGVKTEGATAIERRAFWRDWYTKNRDTK